MAVLKVCEFLAFHNHQFAIQIPGHGSPKYMKNYDGRLALLITINVISDSTIARARGSELPRRQFEILSVNNARTIYVTSEKIA